MKRKSSHDPLTGNELAEIILRLIEKIHKEDTCTWTTGDLMWESVNKIEQICQDVVDEW